MDNIKQLSPYVLLSLMVTTLVLGSSPAASDTGTLTAGTIQPQNETQFPVLAFESTDAQGKPFHVVVARATFQIGKSGVLELAPEQSPLVMADEFFGTLGISSVKEESDLAPYKPSADVVVIGSAVAPDGKPNARFSAGISIRREGTSLLDKRITVMGPRAWEKSPSPSGGWVLSEPSPIQSLPIRYEYAYGGENRINRDDADAKNVPKQFRLNSAQRAAHPDGAKRAPIAHTCFSQNLVGRGYAEPWYLAAKGLHRVEAPQIELVNDPIQELGKPYAVAGFGFLPKASASRIRLLGTMDDAFLKSGKSLPEDFDFAYWNGAPPDMQLPWLQGGEEVVLTNIGGISRFLLPDYKVCADIEFPDRQRSGLEFNADTLVINADAQQVSLVYRLKLPSNQEIQSIEIQWLSKDERAILQQHTAAVNRQVLEYKRAFQKAISERGQ